jgi:uncharacterized protein (DUF2141 family)
MTVLNVKQRLLPILFIALTPNACLQAQTIDVTITGIKSSRGQVIVKVFTDQKSFDDNKAHSVFRFAKSTMKDGTISSRVALNGGVYGFALLDDQNDNGIMDYNIVGMPKEGFGFSDFYLSGFKKPKFDDFKFSLAATQQKKVLMKVRYL